MKLSPLVIQWAVCGQLGSAFSPLLPTSRILFSSQVRPRSRVFSSQWDDEDDDIATEKATSFEDAGAGLQAEDDKKRMDEMGDYDANPSYNSADIDRFRAAIKERANALGIEESKVSQDYIKAAEERAKVAVADRGSGGSQMLDLSQISQTRPRGQDEDVPDIFYEPESEMTPEEMKEADPLGEQPLLDQAMKELAETIWPTPISALKEVVILVAVIAGTAALIIGWDNLLRDFYTNVGLIPGPEDLKTGAENMVLPDGWTDGMSEDDFMKFQDEVGKAATAVKDAAFPDL